MTEAEGGVRELAGDGRILRQVGEAGVGVDVGRQPRQVLVEDDLLILGFDDDLGRLEQHVARPLRGVPRAARGDQHLQLVEDAVVLGLEDAVHGGERVVLVVAAVTGDEVLVEQFVVIAPRLQCTADGGVVVGQQSGTGTGAVAHVVQEGVAGAHDLAAFDHDLGHAAGVAVQAAVGVELQLRQVQHVLVDQRDADALRVDLDVGPVGQAAVELRARRFEVLQHAPGGHAIGVVLLQQRGHHRMRAVVDAHVHPRRNQVVVDALAVVGCNVVVGPRHDHEVGGTAADVQRVPGQQRQVDQPVGALGHQVQVVGEVLPENRMQLARGQPVRRVRRTAVRRGLIAESGC